MKPNKRVRWKPAVILAAALTVGIVLSCLSVGRRHEREDFVGTGVAGYRCKFTIASEWKVRQNYSGIYAGVPEEYTFSPTSNPMWKWITIHLFPHPVSQGNDSNVQPSIFVETTTSMIMLNGCRLQAGYPETDFYDKDYYGASQFVNRRHLRIDGYPATVFDVTDTHAGKTSKGTWLYVYVPQNPNCYRIGGWSAETGPDRVTPEIERIIASFHIENVDKPGGKQ